MLVVGLLSTTWTVFNNFETLDSVSNGGGGPVGGHTVANRGHSSQEQCLNDPRLRGQMSSKLSHCI